jgi:tellurite resistance protein TehA-like permease
MTEKIDAIALEDYKKAHRETCAKEAKIGFVANLTAYIVVNSMLATINLLFVPQLIWFIYPLICWGIGVAMHYTFAVRLFTRIMTKEEARIESLARRGGK